MHAYTVKGATVPCCCSCGIFLAESAARFSLLRAGSALQRCEPAARRLSFWATVQHRWKGAAYGISSRVSSVVVRPLDLAGREDRKQRASGFGCLVQPSTLATRRTARRRRGFHRGSLCPHSSHLDGATGHRTQRQQPHQWHQQPPLAADAADRAAPPKARQRSAQNQQDCGISPPPAPPSAV